MTRAVRTIHAARPGLLGDHRTDGLRCACDPDRLADMNEPGRVVVVHRPMDPRNPPATNDKPEHRPLAGGGVSFPTPASSQPLGSGAPPGSPVPIVAALGGQARSSPDGEREPPLPWGMGAWTP